MDIKGVNLISLIEQELQGIAHERFEETGIVIQVGDNIAKVHGLNNAVYGELIDFDGGNKGIILSLEDNYVAIFLLYAHIAVQELEIAKRSGTVFKAPVGKSLLGRVINAIGEPIDALGALEPERYDPIEVTAPGIIERSPIDEPMQTGIMVIDALVPIGKGQRELIIGNRNTGKTSIVLDIILNQKDKNVVCIYVSIGQRQSNLARLIRLLEEHEAMKYTIIVSADASETVLSQYLAPYVSTTIGEYFMHNKQDVLIIYDDLSNHAIAYREMSLLLRRPPGREAYPGDVFFLHSRLLERAGKLKDGGSLTALPIVQIQGDDITAYIPTNLISITDGQIFLDTQLFNQGIRPAVNVELSVSRVGGAAQTKVIKKLTKALRLELAQYHELLDFSQFGTELDPLSQRKLERGAIAVEFLKQPQYVGYSFVDQALILYLFKENFLNDVVRGTIYNFITQFISYVHSVYADVYNTILETKDLSDASARQLNDIAKEFKKIFVPPYKKA